MFLFFSGCEELASQFLSQEIDGQALLLLKEEHLMSTMNIKLGPALKICAHINNLRDWCFHKSTIAQSWTLEFNQKFMLQNGERPAGEHMENSSFSQQSQDSTRPIWSSRTQICCWFVPSWLHCLRSHLHRTVVVVPCIVFHLCVKSIFNGQIYFWLWYTSPKMLNLPTFGSFGLKTCINQSFECVLNLDIASWNLDFHFNFLLFSMRRAPLIVDDCDILSNL